MPKSILIVESDSAGAAQLREKLTARGFAVEETFDGKRSLDLARQTRPELILLAVELSAGQNGYILCGKLKKDDDLKTIPVIIMGSPEGFPQHRKLKTRADEYEEKPVQFDSLMEKIGNLIGLPDTGTEEVISVSDLESDDAGTHEFASEEISIDAGEATLEGDSELQMLDAAFDGMTDAEAAAASNHRAAPPVVASGDDDAAGRTVVSFDSDSPGDGHSGGHDDSALHARVQELEQALADAQARSQELETQLAQRPAAGSGSSSSSGGGKQDKELLSLKDAANKKEKEVLRLRAEQHQKDQEILELKDREVQLEQQLSDANDQLGERDAKLQAATQKAEQAVSEKRKLEKELAQLKEEARGATQLREQLEQAESARTEAETELSTLRVRVSDLETERDAARYEVDEAKRGSDSLQAELDSLKEQLTDQARAFADEVGGLRRRISELEESAKGTEQRAANLLAQLKDDEQRREKTREALSLAMQLLEEQPAGERSDLDVLSLTAQS